MHSVASEIPAIPRPSWQQRHPRALGLVVSLPCWAIWGVSLWLHPSPRGYDTHTQLRLPPCGFMQTTGLPCPTCGMTTAFSQMAHGRVMPALQAQPFGALLFASLTLMATLATGQAVSGRRLLRVELLRPWMLWACLGGMLIGWTFKLAVGLANGQLPVR